jgi:glycosyltransferase 2 family protein
MIKNLIRIVMTCILIGWLVMRVDFSSVGAIFARSHMGWLAAAGAINLLAIFCAAWRWQVLLRGLDIVVGFFHLLRIVFVGAFFSMFLPSSVGGDLMKMVLISPEIKQREAAVSSVLMDRVVGMAVTLLVGLLAVLLLPSVWGNNIVLSALGAVSLAFGFGLVTLFSKTLISVISKLVPGLIWRRVGGMVMRVHGSLMTLRGRPGILLAAAAIALLRQVVICLSVYCAGQAFGIDAGLVAYFALIPVSMAITVLPIAINGLGLQDNALILLLSTVGVTAAQALSLSLFLHIMRNGVGLLGGLIFALIRHRLPQPEPTIAVEDSPNERDQLQPVRQ